jgi:uncharacterized protein YjbI with pentapeptide repeats
MNIRILSIALLFGFGVQTGFAFDQATLDFVKKNKKLPTDKKKGFLTDLSKANLEGANLTGANLTGANLSGSCLEIANLTGANFSGADLTGANLSGANIKLTNFEGAKLPAAQFLYAGRIIDKKFLKKNSQVKDDLKNIKYADQPTHPRFKGADLAFAKFNNADLREAYFAGANLKHANFSGADLSGADLTGANLKHANHIRVNFTGAKQNNIPITKQWLKDQGAEDHEDDSARIDELLRRLLEDEDLEKPRK